MTPHTMTHAARSYDLARAKWMRPARVSLTRPLQARAAIVAARYLSDIPDDTPPSPAQERPT